MSNPIKEQLIENMKPEDKQRLLKLLQAKEYNYKYRKLYSVYFQDEYTDPETGLDLSRDKYSKYIDFINAGAQYRERFAIAGNRSGKTETICLELGYHLTKDYPSWYKGYRFKRGIKTVFIGKTNLSIRDVGQDKLLGMQGSEGDRILPLAEHNDGVGIVKWTPKPGVPGAVLDIFVRDRNGDMNQIMFISQEVDFGVIMGGALDFIWFDEECLNHNLYQEAKKRVVTTNGLIVHTFTPLHGMTNLLMEIIPNRQAPIDGIVRDKEGHATHRYVTTFPLSEAPHITKEQLKYAIDSCSSQSEVESRIYGIPSIGAGQIYPIREDDLVCEPFKIPDHWRRAFGLDFGWEETAAVWMAEDPNTKTRYVYAEYARGHQTTFNHIQALAGYKDENKWIPGAADPSGGGRNTDDGRLVIEQFIDRGFDLINGQNALAAGIMSLLMQFEAGTLKIFTTCKHLLREIALYKYDDFGKPAQKQDDHCADALRYLDSRFDDIALSRMAHEDQILETSTRYPSRTRDTRDDWTGY